MSATTRFRLAFRLALREMRGGLSGFYIFLACIALGTGAIAAVNSVAGSVTGAMQEQGQTILAGDIRFQINNRDVTPEEEAYFKSFGEVSRSDTIRSMARKADGSDQTLSEVKAVDGGYPLYGTLQFEPQTSPAEALAQKDGTFGVIAAPDLLDRLKLKVGDGLLVGNAKLRITGSLVKEPDALSEGFAFAPRLIVSRDALAAAGLLQTGSLVEHVFRVKLPVGTPMPTELKKKTDAAFPNSGIRIATSKNAAPALNDTISRFTEFLTLVGLTALIVGGSGVANAVRAYLDSKRGVIATFKCLGAPASTVTLIYMLQILMIAAVGILAGLVLGAVAPMIANRFLAEYLPVDPTPALFPTALLIAALFGLLTAAGFAILPLGRARDVPATALFREQGFEPTRWPARPFALAAGVVFLAIAGLAVFTAQDRRIALYFLGAIIVAFVILRLVGIGIAALARRSPSFRSPVVRLALGNIHRPGALTGPVVLSLGLGLMLLVTLALIDGNMRRELQGSMAVRAPDYFFIDIQSRDLAGFEDVVKKSAPTAKLVEAPMLRGRLTALNGTDVSQIKAAESVRWVLNGDRGITYSDSVPENATVTEGAWWPKDYTGEPLVSFSEEEGKELGLKVGDTVTVNVLGRQITARIANMRKVDWRSMGINFVMVFTPSTFKGAPHAWLATLTGSDAERSAENSVVHAVTNAYPGVTTINIKDAIDTVTKLTGQIALAIRVAASVALISSVLVLAGALAAGNRARIHDAVVLKTLGATRRTLIAAFGLEYALLGLATAIFALIVGAAASYGVVHLIMTLPWHFDPWTAVLTALLSLVVTVGVGLIGTWRVLGQKAAPVLREL
ncbi:putative ABC transport system permease protein [Rhizobium aquaticum]|uniref:ABC transport system permease protein n=1 Tax=Rhizobium aquaticum TaxID=1549636 RepID=A0ABV2IYR8_9HYPH